MRCHYREKAYFAGPFLDVDIYPVFAKAGSRQKKFKPSTPCQQRLNEKRSVDRLVRLVNANFTKSDLACHPTYRDDIHPKDEKTALRNIENFIRRLKRFRKKANLPELKYVAVTEISQSGRFHHHLIISGGVTLEALADIWGKGYVSAKPLQFDEKGVSGLAAYMVKDPIGGKRYKASRNLLPPVEKVKDERLSRRKVIEMADTEKYAQVMEELYPGYEFVCAQPFYNDYNRHQYITVKMYIPPKRGRNSEVGIRRRKERGYES